jgi:hypothetical protein
MKVLHLTTIFKSDCTETLIILSVNGCKGLKGNRALRIKKIVLGFRQGRLEINIYYSLVKFDTWKE